MALVDLIEVTKILPVVREQSKAIEDLSNENKELNNRLIELKKDLDHALVTIEERYGVLRELIDEKMNTHKESVTGTAERIASERVAAFVSDAGARLHELALKVDRIERTEIQSRVGLKQSGLSLEDKVE